MKKKPKKPPKSNLLRWATLTGYSFQLGITIYLFVRLGRWLDATYETDRLFTLLGVLLGLFLSLYILLKQLKKLNL